MAYIVKIDDKEFKIDIKREGGKFIVFLDNKEIPIEVVRSDTASQFTLIIDKKPHDVVFDADNLVSVDGEEFSTEVYDEQVQKLLKKTPQVGEKKELTVTAPMPGLVIEVEVAEGDVVKAGQGLVIVEAMKMQNEMKSPGDGVVKKILVQKGQAVNSRDVLVVIG
ncbi:MAG: biotin/lipoyl-binding protein [candidate division WOR-3 bacterium]|nr:MAG: biotin/lipoyl-binding protein [candidate division WOR-3 bacterium]